MPHRMVMMRMLQPGNDLEVVDDVIAGDSRKVKSAEAEVISQRSKHNLVACLIRGNDIIEVSQTTKASMALKKERN